MKLVGIDYQQGATGNYLEYIGNVFLIPTVPFHNPFTENNTSHNRIRNRNSIFLAEHYFLNNSPHALEHCEILFKKLDKVVWINVSPEDFEKFKLVKIAKVGNGHAPSDESYFKWNHAKSLIFEDAMKPDWVQDNSAFIFDWGSLFLEKTFYLELDKLCNFCNAKFFPTNQLRQIHKEFLTRHSYVL